MSDGYTVRPVTDDEFGTFARTTEAPFFSDVSDERLERWRRITELERTLAVFDGDAIVGGSLLLRMQVSIPGGQLPMGGLTAVGILPTHRRRGLLTKLMTRHLTDLRAWEEPLSGLYAAEAPIYGRYGYGSAAPTINGTIATAASTFRPSVALETGAISLVDLEEALASFPAIYESVRAQRSGMPERNEAYWRNWLGEDSPQWRGGLSHRYLARLGDRGYVVYRAKTDEDSHGLPNGTLAVMEHMAVDTPAAATLWRYVFDHDLITTVRVGDRPTDDILPLLLQNPRALVGHPTDGLWLRPVDVARVLAARTYPVEGSITLGVVDPMIPDNTGSWALEGGADGGQCRRTNADPDLRLDVADLGAAYLGAMRFQRLVRAGRAEELTPGAARRADLLFWTDPAPWSPLEF
jgi:predicted acetyltransferase